MAGTAGKVFMACALGGGIGAFVALQMWQPFWWVGMLVGGLVGYLTYEFNEVRRAIPIAWRKVANWHPNKEWWGIFLQLFPVLVIGLPGTILLSLFVFGCAVRYMRGFDFPADYMLLLLNLGATVMLSAEVASDGANQIVDGRKDLATTLRNYQKYTIFGVYFVILPQGVLLAMRWIAQFSRYLFFIIHSEMRLLCGLDATIGAAIGYWLGNAIIGALAGGIFGLANFEIVSRRWLKLVPMTK